MFDAFLEVECFRLAFPKFKNEAKWPSDTLVIALENADDETSGSRWGEYKDAGRNRKRKGLFLYAAHWLTVYYPNGASNEENQSTDSKGQLTSKSVADESASYAVVVPKNIGEAADAWFLKTQFGQEFLRIRKRTLMGAMAL